MLVLDCFDSMAMIYYFGTQYERKPNYNEWKTKVYDKPKPIPCEWAFAFELVAFTVVLALGLALAFRVPPAALLRIAGSPSSSAAASSHSVCKSFPLSKRRFFDGPGGSWSAAFIPVFALDLGGISTARRIDSRLDTPLFGNIRWDWDRKIEKLKFDYEYFVTFFYPRKK